MLEIILVWAMAKSIARRCKAKGRSAAGWVVLFVALWIGGEVMGGIVGAILADGKIGAGVYFCALMGAALGAITGFVIVNTLPAIQSEEDYYRQGNAGPTPQLPDARYDEKFGDYHDRARNSSQEPAEEPGQYRSGQE